MSSWRKQKVPQILLDQAPLMQCRQKDVHDGHLSVFYGYEPGGFHLSISHRTNDHPAKPGRYPTWDEILDARWRFCPLNTTMIILLPPQEEYVNLHETTFHLWEQAPDVEAMEVVHHE